MSESAAAAPDDHTQGQAEQVAPVLPEDFPEMHPLNLELLKSQRKLEQAGSCLTSYAKYL